MLRTLMIYGVLTIALIWAGYFEYKSYNPLFRLIVRECTCNYSDHLDVGLVGIYMSLVLRLHLNQ